jgi:hypothetical protein
MSLLSRAIVTAAVFTLPLPGTPASAQEPGVPIPRADLSEGHRSMRDVTDVSPTDDIGIPARFPGTFNPKTWFGNAGEAVGSRNNMERPLFDASRAFFTAPASPGAPVARSQESSWDRDSVLDGVFIGAAIGIAGGALGVWAWCQGDYKGECDDEPGRGPLALRTALIGAGAGAVLGWVVDLNRSGGRGARQSRRSHPPTLVVTPVAFPSRKALQLTLRY